MDGILRCARYAFGPNRLHYCGPDANRELLAHIEHEAADLGLAAMLRKFRTMYPYLREIATANAIADPFDDRVVEAYWIGNDLLHAVTAPRLYRHLLDDHHMKDRLGPASFRAVDDAIGKGAVPHHSFHVLAVWRRTGHQADPHTVESMDACRISWAEVKEVDGPMLRVMRAPLRLVGDMLELGPASPETIKRPLDARDDIDRIRPGDHVTVHWGVPCEAVTREQVRHLAAFTRRHIRTANAAKAFRR